MRIADTATERQHNAHLAPKFADISHGALVHFKLLFDDSSHCISLWLDNTKLLSCKRGEERFPTFVDIGGAILNLSPTIYLILFLRGSETH